MHRLRGQQRIVRPEAKRRRPPRACVQCYRRKLKCGRESPACSRCVKAGNGQECAYRGESRPGVPGGSAFPGPPVTIEEMSSTLRVVEQTELSSYSLQHAQSPQPRQDERMTHLKGQGTTTRFYGFSYHLNLYQQFPGLRPYIAQIKARHPTIDQLRDEIYSVAAKRPRRYQLSNPEILDHEEALRQQIPSRSIADKLLQTYMDRFEIIHRVLHIPEFMEKYSNHWTQPQLTPTLYLAQLLLVMAAAASFHFEEPMETMSFPSIRPLAGRWIEVAEAWLVSSSSEPPESWSALATHCLLVIAKRANYVQEEALWTATGTLVKWAMAAGYHREAGPTVQLSPFHREMRRRLWATILELDIQASIERGMLPTIRKGDFRTHPVLHVDDVAIQEWALVPPLPQQLTSWTDTSFQTALQRSVTVRLEVCALVNGSLEEVEFDEILRLGSELTQAVRDIPAWDDHTSPQQQQATSYAKTMLSLILYQNLLILHIPWAIQTPPTFRSGIARRARLEAASAIVSHYKRLVNDKIIPESGCRNGLVLAALSICHDLHLSCAGPEPSESMSTIPELAEIFISMTERAMEIIGKRVITQLNGLNEYYVVCMAIGLVKSKLWPESQFISSEEAAERAIRVSTLVRSSATALDSPRQSHAGPDSVELASFEAAGEDIDLFSSLFSDDLGFLKQDLDLGLFYF